MSPQHATEPGGRLFVLADHPTCIGGERMARVIECHAAPIAERIVQCVNAHDDLIACMKDAASLIDYLGGNGKYLREAIDRATGAQHDK